MNAEALDDQHAMAAALAAVSAWLEVLAKKPARALRPFAIEVPPGTALARVAEVFALSRFELHTLVLLASVELHPRIVRLIAAVDEFNRDDGPVPTAEVARHLGRRPQSLSPARDGLIKKGLVYAAERGSVAFTVPHFGQFLRDRP